MIMIEMIKERQYKALRRLWCDSSYERMTEVGRGEKRQNTCGKMREAVKREKGSSRLSKEADRLISFPRTCNVVSILHCRTSTGTP